MNGFEGLSSADVAKAFPGARFVKGFNHLPARTLAADPNVNGRRRVVFLSSDDETATARVADRSEEHTSELQSLMRISYAVFCLKKQNNTKQTVANHKQHRPQE